MIRSKLFILFLFLLIPLLASEQPIMRFPDVHESWVVFVAGGDIWKAPVTGGEAIRLTMHDGDEAYPRFSPDGKLIAFTGEYDGNSDIYVMNADGSNIRRVTWHPGYDRMVEWNPANGKIIFASSRHSYSRFTRLFMINPDGSGLEEIPIYEAAQGTFSPDGKKIAYNHVSRENRTWKRYKGGTAQDVFVYDFDTRKEIRITDFRGTDRIPMWVGDNIYFTSDRDRFLNIYAYNVNTKETKQLTFHNDYDARFPSAGNSAIVYEHSGDIWKLDLNSGKYTKIDIRITTDAPETRPYWKKVDDLITDIDVSPNGKRALISARGDIFTAPAENGSIRNLTKSSGSREKDAVWSPDGQKIAFFSDRDGEYELYIMDAKGLQKPEKITTHKDGFRHTLRWSPDGKKIAFTDQTLTLYYVDVTTKKITKVDKAEYENIDVSLELKPIYDFRWSPDSRFLAYSKMNADLVYQVYVYSLDEKKVHRISNGLFNDFQPVFADDGQHLLFISNRRFDPTFDDFQWEMVYKKVAGIYAVALTKNAPAFFPLKSDESVENKTENQAVKTVHFDFDGIGERVEPLPLPRGNYRWMSVTKNTLFFLDKEEGDFNRFEFRKPDKMDLYALDLTGGEKKVVIKDINAYKLAFGGEYIVYKKDKSVGILPATTRDSQGKPLNLADLKMKIDPIAEWNQMFNEAWRMERDFYYEPNMHGLDWPAMKEKYAKMMKRVISRQDVRYVIGELIGELNTSHTYVYGGDRLRKAERVNIGLLGADYEVKNGLYRFKKIYDVPDWSREIKPPLRQVGNMVNEGEYLLAVNGQKVTADRNLYSYFENLAGKVVELTVSPSPDWKKARTVLVKPTGNEYWLRYLAWTEHNRQVAEKASGGKIGYIHLPDTYMGSAVEFPKYFFTQVRKEGLIIDGRFNGGGLDPDIFLRRLRSEIHSYWTRRYSHDQTAPQFATRAHMVCITNRQAGSGGDELPFEFKQSGMGPVIGTRSWGGLVGVSMFLDLIDGGGLTAPDYRIYTPEGKWVVENEGVTPDIEIDLDPAQMQDGYDAQLQKAIEILMKKIKEEPITWPKHEPFPVDR